MNKNKRYGQELDDGTVVNWRKKRRIKKKKKKLKKLNNIWKLYNDYTKIPYGPSINVNISPEEYKDMVIFWDTERGKRR